MAALAFDIRDTYAFLQTLTVTCTTLPQSTYVARAVY